MVTTQYMETNEPVSDTARGVVSAEPQQAVNARATQTMARYAAGEERAFDELYALLAPRLRRLCGRLVGPIEAEDLLQEVFLKMHRARASFVPEGSVLSWACAIARTTCIDRRRQQRRRPEDAVEPGRLDGYAHSARHQPETSSAALAQALDAALRGLSDSLRSAYVLMNVEGLGSSDAASQLGISAHAVKKRASRAGEELRRSVRAAGLAAI